MNNDFKWLYKIILVGDSNTGKTCLLRMFTKGVLPKIAVSTIGVEFSSKIVQLENEEKCKL